jgi:2-haloacid dehalogenase
LKFQRDQKRFKPAKEVYENLLASIGARDVPSRVWLVSRYACDRPIQGDINLASLSCSNPFDVTGALSVGMKAIWVDRAGAGWADQLLGSQSPTKVVSGLGEIAQFVKEIVQ